MFQHLVVSISNPSRRANYERAEDFVDGMSSAQDFLRAIGRNAEKKVPVEKWGDLFRMRRDDFKTLGVGVQDRRSFCLFSPRKPCREIYIHADT